MKKSLLVLLLAGASTMLSAADIISSSPFVFVQPLGDYQIVGVLKIGDVAEVTVVHLESGRRYLAQEGGMLAEYQITQVVARGRESYVVVERTGAAYRIGLKLAESPERTEAFQLALLNGNVEASGRLTPAGRSAIEENLSRLRDAANETLAKTNATSVSFQTLSKNYAALEDKSMNPDPFSMYESNYSLKIAFANLSPVAGEDYSMLQFTNARNKVQVMTRFGDVVVQEVSRRRGCSFYTRSTD